MPSYAFVSLDTLLSGDAGDLSRLTNTAHRLVAIERVVQRVLQAPTAEEVRAARLSDGVLTLLVSSPAWSSRLRYAIPQVLEQLHADLPALRIDDVRLRTRPPAPEPARRHPPARAARLSDDTARLLAEVARGTDDPALRAILDRLARRR